ncbi:dipeptidyl-peptidase [Trypanosoma conorhini]|uniref:Dipeptidyl-peptidase n=1 Tax=Trypanosoma conorhini TaxID=83891 RepID=A0A3R7PIW9_9TRYP|nr:dipeptidyl-peptidase [Trypanosoma conorhini]RNF20644.1 dipeptidyl-peptidase [Trypanosoma conorhini]
MLFAQLSDVAPDGAVSRVSFGVKDLTQAAGDDRIEYLQQGRRVRARALLNYCAHRFGTGHRLRLSLANGHWPTFWVPPGANTLALDLRTAALLLPTFRGPPIAGPDPQPEAAPPTPSQSCLRGMWTAPSRTTSPRTSGRALQKAWAASSARTSTVSKR